MPRSPRAASQLVTEVKARFPDAIVMATDLDGFGVFRSFLFEPEVAQWLEPVLNYAKDNRIVGLRRDDNDDLVVTFSHRSAIADKTDHFMLNAYEVIIAGREIQPPEPAAPRKARKKAAKRSVHPGDGSA